MTEVREISGLEDVLARVVPPMGYTTQQLAQAARAVAHREQEWRAEAALRPSSEGDPKLFILRQAVKARDAWLREKVKANG